MNKVFYMKFDKGHRGSLDKVGGLPTHIPPFFPQSSFTGKQLGFLFQIYCDNEKLQVPGALCIQAYQSVDIDSGDDGQPVVIKVPINSLLNEENKGTISPEIGQYDILWEQGEEPDELPENMGCSPENLKWMNSKLGGAQPTEFNNKKFIGWIAEYPVDFNFGGMLNILLKDDGEIESVIT
jgi:hypothetical protein